MLAQPWGPDGSVTPARLSVGGWQESRDKPPVTFFTLTSCSPRPESAVSDAMDFALDLWRHPERYTEAPYAVGARVRYLARCHRWRPWLRVWKLVERAGLGGVPGARCRLPPGPFGAAEPRCGQVRLRGRQAPPDHRGARGRGLLRRSHCRDPRLLRRPRTPALPSTARLHQGG